MILRHTKGFDVLVGVAGGGGACRGGMWGRGAGLKASMGGRPAYIGPGALIIIIMNGPSFVCFVGIDPTLQYDYE